MSMPYPITALCVDYDSTWSVVAAALIDRALPANYFFVTAIHATGLVLPAAWPPHEIEMVAEQLGLERQAFRTQRPSCLREDDFDGRYTLVIALDSGVADVVHERAGGRLRPSWPGPALRELASFDPQASASHGDAAPPRPSALARWLGMARTDVEAARRQLELDQRSREERFAQMLRCMPGIVMLLGQFASESS